MPRLIRATPQPASSTNITLLLSNLGDAVMSEESEFAQSPIVVNGEAGNAYQVAFAKLPVNADGTPGATSYWNHAAATWDAAFDPAVHLKPCIPIGPPGSAIESFCTYSVPTRFVLQRSVHALVVSSPITPDGKPGAWNSLSTEGLKIYSELF